jgi:excinuclease ABC subunit C
VKRFDRKFGAELWRELPESPGVYLFKDAAGTVLYVGKAVNLRRRLQRYRSAGRRKAQRKMRALVREASALEIRPQQSERASLLLENQLIRTLRPVYNVDGAYFFLYPAVGIWQNGRQTVLILTTRQPEWAAISAAWYGTFRSRLRAREAFEAWRSVLAYLGHVEPKSNLSGLPHVRGSHVIALRRLDLAVVELLHAYWSGASRSALGELAERLVERPGARQKAAEIQASLRVLDVFYADDILKLRETLLSTRGEVRFVAQQERDALFIEHRAVGVARR